MIVLFFYTLFMLCVHFLIVFGIIRVCRKEKKSGVFLEKIPFKATIIIPARNEEKNLPMLFKSLEHNMVSGLEIILVDDRSTDRTLGMMKFFASMHSNVKVISNKDNPPENMNPKHFVQSIAFKSASGDIILLTDADCVIPPDWVKNICRYFQNPSVGLVFGAVMTIPGDSFLARYQCCDHLMRFFYTVGAVGLGSPSGGFGNNMAVRKSALDDVGGFDGIGFSLTEDAQLIAAMRNSGKWNVVAVPGKETMVYAQGQKKFSDVLHQEIRWSAGGIFGQDKLTAYLYIFMMLYPLAGAVGLMLGMTGPFALGCYLFAVWGLSLVTFVGSFYNHSDWRFRAFIIPCVMVAVPLYAITFLAAFFKKNITWKEKKLKKSI